MHLVVLQLLEARKVSHLVFPENLVGVCVLCFVLADAIFGLQSQTLDFVKSHALLARCVVHLANTSVLNLVLGVLQALTVEVSLLSARFACV